MLHPKEEAAGYVLVPREPNGKMINAAMDEYAANGYEISWTGIYKAMLAASPPPVPDAVIERAKEAAVEKYVAFDCDLSREAFIEGAKFSANLLAKPLDREAVARFSCADDLMAWLNTLETKVVEKKTIYKWAMEWRPPAAHANTPAPTKQCTCGAGGVKHNVDAPYRCQCDLDAPASPASDGKVEGEKS